LQALILLETRSTNHEDMWSVLSRLPGVDGALFLERGVVMIKASFADIGDLNQAVKFIRGLEFVRSTETRIVLTRLEGKRHSPESTGESVHGGPSI
jgi:hypothetical protein